MSAARRITLRRHSPMCNRTSWMRHLAQARNPYSPSWLWIPGSRFARPGMTGLKKRKQQQEGNTMAYETIKYEVAEQILTITLNRPDKLNAFNGQMQQELIDAFDQADEDDNVRAIIVTGAGRGFCAGADLSSGANTFDRDARRRPVK